MWFPGLFKMFRLRWWPFKQLRLLCEVPLDLANHLPFYPLPCLPAFPGIPFGEPARTAVRGCAGWWWCRGSIPSGRSCRRMCLCVYVDRLQADGSKAFCSKNTHIYNSVLAARNKVFWWRRAGFLLSTKALFGWTAAHPNCILIGYRSAFLSRLRSTRAGAISHGVASAPSFWSSLKRTRNYRDTGRQTRHPDETGRAQQEVMANLMGLDLMKVFTYIYTCHFHISHT